MDVDPDIERLREELPSSLDEVEFEDTLEPVGIVAGAFVALVGLGTIVGMGWQYKPLLAAVIQIGGALAAVVVGVGLIWLAQTQVEMAE